MMHLFHSETESGLGVGLSTAFQRYLSRKILNVALKILSMALKILNMASKTRPKLEMYF